MGGLLLGMSVAAVAVVSCREPATPPQHIATPRRPNLVFVLVDDMRWDDLGAAGRGKVALHRFEQLHPTGEATIFR